MFSKDYPEVEPLPPDDDRQPACGARFRWEKAMRGAGLRQMLRVYVHNLASYMTADGDRCWPSAQVQADDLGVARATVFMLQREAVASGWPLVESKKGARQGGQG